MIDISSTKEHWVFFIAMKTQPDNIIREAMSILTDRYVHGVIFGWALEVSSDYSNVSKFIPKVSAVKSELRKVFVKGNYSPSRVKLNNGSPSSYCKEIIWYIKKQFFENVTDKTETSNGRNVSDKKLRYFVHKFINYFGLNGNGNEIHICPKDLRTKLNQCVEYLHPNENNIFMKNGIIHNEQHFRQLGDLYTLIVLMYAFEPYNYDINRKTNKTNVTYSQTELSKHHDDFKQIIQNSKNNSETQDFLKIYHLQYVTDPDYKQFIKEIICQKKCCT